jgi:hypothetical protein
MTRRLPIALGVLLAAAGLLEFTAAPAAAATTLFVATNGSDSWSGTRETPNAEGTDGPLASMARARDAIRALKAAGQLSAPVRVLVRGGVYYLDETLAFGPEDSGSEGLVISYEAFPGERPELVGGRRIEGFQPGKEDGSRVFGGYDFRPASTRGELVPQTRSPFRYAASATDVRFSCQVRRRVSNGFRPHRPRAGGDGFVNQQG